MARYIDADKMVSKDNAYTTFPHDLAGCDDNDLVRWINEQPTADVVPKSEFEQLQHKYELSEAEREANVKGFADEITKANSEVARLEQDVTRLVQEKDNLIKNYAECMKDYAREIFGEIEKLSHKFMNDQHYIFGDMLWDINELKKKYTEERE